ncbi:MAG: Binding-protein-dependent transport systems inner membrane component [Petrotoga mobilis]|nr:MAG: Binding-protein-dependent transport systems inner membrane component [Petrotoga mobilis]
MNNIRSKNLLFILFLCLWLIPFSFLFKDFFRLEGLVNFLDPRTWRILGFTFYQAILSSVLSLVITLIPAYFASRNEGIISKLLDNTIFIPFFFPPVSAVMAFTLVYSSVGILSKLGFSFDIMYTLKAIILAHVFYNSPIFVRYISEALRRVPASFTETASIEGASKFKTFINVELPLIIPSISRALFLVFTYNFTSFAIVLSLGGVKYSTLEVAISKTLRSTLDFPKALSYALIQLIILTMLNIVISKFEPISFEYEPFSQKKSGYLSRTISAFYLIFEYSIVLVGIAASFFDFINMKFDISSFLHLFSKELNRVYPVVRSIINSFLVSAIAALFAVITAYFLLKNYSKLINVSVMATLGISSAFLGMALLYLNILFDIPFVLLLILGYFLITIPIAYSFLFQPVRGFDDKIIEAAKIDGANNLIIFLKIELPLLFSSFISAFLQIFAMIFGEFTISYTMQVRDYFPLASVVNYSLSSGRLYQEANALSGLNILLIFFIFYISNKFVKKSEI